MKADGTSTELENKLFEKAKIQTIKYSLAAGAMILRTIDAGRL